MSIREQLWACIGDRTVTRAELYERFGPDVRKAISRLEKMGEMVRDGDRFRMGVRMEVDFQPWTPAEDDTLHDHVREGYDALCELIPHRTRNAIKCRCKALGLTATKPPVLKLDAALSRVPVFVRGHLSPVVRACLPEAA